MATTLPPLPTDSNSPGPNVSAGATPGNSSPFGGGLSSMMMAVQQIESGYKMLASQLPSLAPLAADAVSKLRIAIPNAVGAGAQSQPGAQPQGGPPQGQAQGSLPPPPQQGAQ